MHGKVPFFLFAPSKKTPFPTGNRTKSSLIAKPFRYSFYGGYF
jgi:hypothetical protein